MHKTRKSKSKSKASEKMSEVVISNEAKELAEIMMCYNSFQPGEIFIRLPIDTIDGLYVNCIIQSFREKKGLLFDIELEGVDAGCGSDVSVYSYRCVEKDDKTITNEFCETFCQTIFTELPLLTLSCGGELVTANTPRQIAYEKLDILFKNFNCNNITKMCSTECCVCYNKTHTKTKCKHPLCYRCWSKMSKINADKNNQDDDEDEEYIKCPICREDI
jgi:hypothetical protein